MNLFYQSKLSEGTFELDPEEGLHVVKVLRHKVGDVVPVTDGRGNLFQCQIRNISGMKCTVAVVEKKFIAKPGYFIHIALSPTKSQDRTEWFAEKATEIGVQKISFIQTHRSERKRVNLERIQKIILSAFKQSGQVWIPEFSGLTDFENALTVNVDQKFIAHADMRHTNHLQQMATKKKSYLVLIGPEGDFTDEEIESAHEAGFQSAGLGPTVLRTETAGVVACHILNLIQGP